MKKSVVIIDSGGANTGSITYALDRLDCSSIVTSDPEVIRSADRLLLPGVGAAEAAMKRLRENGLDEVIRSLEQPVLGICLGMQLLGTHSAEGDVTCLGVVDFETRRLKHPRVPQMGWNRLDVERQSPLVDGLDGEFAYFVHSYRVPIIRGTSTTVYYGEVFSASFSVDNFHGVQFHPERSSKAGSRLLENFLTL